MTLSASIDWQAVTAQCHHLTLLPTIKSDISKFGEGTTGRFALSRFFNISQHISTLRILLSNENWFVEVFKKSTDLHVGMKLSTGCLWILFLHQLGKLPVAPDGNSSADSSNSRLFKEMSWFEKRPGQSDGWQRCLQPGRGGFEPFNALSYTYRRAILPWRDTTHKAVV